MYSRKYIIIILAFALLPLQAFSQDKYSSGEPANAPVEIKLSENKDTLSLYYEGQSIFRTILPESSKVNSDIKKENDKLEQHIIISLIKEGSIRAWAFGSNQTIAAETKGTAQERFPLIRTSHGVSNNLRNNAIYERMRDWMIQMPEGSNIQAETTTDGSNLFHIELKGKDITLVFMPRYYQKHKHLTYYRPWTYDVYENSITGWSSWWAYFRNFNESEMDKLLDVWKRKNLSDYGYRFIQIDDVYQGEYDKQRDNGNIKNYIGGRPTTWLDWKKDLFPGGMNHYVKSVKSAGFSPAVWMGCFFSDVKTTNEHPEWFMSDANNKPVVSPWVGYVMDATNEDAKNNLIRPVFRGIKHAGVEYVKIDQLRHFLFDGLHNQPQWTAKKGIKSADVLRNYLGTAREELGKNTFILACWGVLPEAIGLVDACRIGGDGYGPATLQQYNSWNGLVWRNDPDHCDIKPEKHGLGQGNITEVKTIKSAQAESIIRPALASIAGAMLMLSDKPEVYEDSLNLVGMKKVSPVLFSVPGQLYNFDSSKSDWLENHSTEEIVSGTNPSPIDGDQYGVICPFWLNEYNMGYENWVVLHRLNWKTKEDKVLPATSISFSDIGLDAKKEYFVYEFWTNQYIGLYKNRFNIPELKTNGIASYAIRENKGRPQLLSTNRHLSQGAAELEKLAWDGKTLNGRSHVIAGDEYEMTFFIPKGYLLKSVSLLSGERLNINNEGNICKVKYTPAKTESIEWLLDFTKQ